MVGRAARARSSHRLHLQAWVSKLVIHSLHYLHTASRSLNHPWAPERHDSDIDDSINNTGSDDGSPMAAAATQQFSLVVQLGISFATVGLELYSGVPIPTQPTEEARLSADRNRANDVQEFAAAPQAELDGSLPLNHVVSQPAAAEEGGVAASSNRDVTGLQRLAIRLYFVCSGFGTRMMWYSLNVALPYFTQLYGPEVYPRMLLAYNVGAIVALLAQVLGDARFDALYGPTVTTCFRVNLGVGCMFLLMLYFPHTANHAYVPVILCAAVGVLDYFATGSLTQMASRVGGIVPTFFFLGQALSGAFLFGFTSSVDWSVEEMAVDNVQHYKHSHQDVPTPAIIRSLRPLI